MKFLGPVLFGRKGGHRCRKNAREAEPILTTDFFEWLEDLVADSKIHMKLDEGPAI